MATEKTPAHKRIRRAEQGRDEWKIKAQLRREYVLKKLWHYSLANLLLLKNF